MESPTHEVLPRSSCASGTSRRLSLSPTRSIFSTETASQARGRKSRIAKANEIIAKIGFGSYHWRLFLLCGCGWFADNMWLQGVSVIIPSLKAEFGLSDAQMGIGSTFAFLGMMIGGGFWGIISDVIGRKPAFTLTLLITAVFGFYASYATTFPQYYWRIFFLGTGVGGNLPVDGSLFLEFVPPSHQRLMTLLSLFWPVGQVFTASIAWHLLPQGSCTVPERTVDLSLNLTHEILMTAGDPCDITTDNWAWRIVLRLLAAVTLLMVVGRLGLVKMLESPKFLLSIGRVEEAECVLRDLAEANGWEGELDELKLGCDLEDEDEDSEEESLFMGESPAVDTNEEHHETGLIAWKRFALRLLTDWKESFQVGWVLLKQLFEPGVTRQTTILILLIWSLISLGYTMFNGFLPIFLASTPDGESPPISVDETFQNYFILAAMGVPGSVVGTYMIDTTLGRRGTMAASTFGTAASLYLFTLSRTSSFQLVCGSIVSVLQNTMYGVLYTYTPEVFESKVRGTASGAASFTSRIFGCLAPLLTGWLIGFGLGIPLVLASLMIFAAGVCMVALPLETRGREVL